MFETDLRSRTQIPFYPRFRTHRGTNPLVRYYLDIQTAAMNFGPSAPVSSFARILDYALDSSIHHKF